MKRKSLIVALLPVLFGLFALQSCSEEEGYFKVYDSFSEPTATAPLDGAGIYITGTTVDLKWATVDSDGDTPKADVYFGTDEDPALYKSGVNALLLNVPVATGNTYYWRVEMIDANNVKTSSPVFHFTVLVKFEMKNMVGLFDCLEPGYGHYNCNLTSVNATTVSNDNFWDSGWTVQYKFNADGTKIDIIPVTISGYSIAGSGAFDNMTGQFYVDYTVYQGTKLIDDNTHTFTKK
ncbi:MAG TPA: hypothetical protein VN249_00660 [Prolixibacteraceae bacterium]|nr:hypothetical protein [Prolixibacteraceae bacterium]